MTVLLLRTWVAGTPRGFGAKKSEDVWIDEIRAALAHVRAPLCRKADRCEVILDFLVNPQSKKYNGQNLPHGTDLDNMIKMTIDGLQTLRGRGLGLIEEDSSVYRIVAGKEHVADDRLMGCWIEISGI